MSLLFLCLLFFLSHSLLPFPLRVPCTLLWGSMWGIPNASHDSWKGKALLTFPNSLLIFYTTKCVFLLLTEWKRNTVGLYRLFFLTMFLFFWLISNQRLTIWLPKPGRQVSVTSLLPLFSKVWLNLTLPASTPRPKPTPTWPTFSTTLLWMLITMFWPQLMQVTWPLRQGQGPFTVHQVLPVLAPLHVLPSLTPTHLSHLLPLQGISLRSSGWNTWSFP